MVVMRNDIIKKEGRHSMCYHKVVERQFIYVSKRVEKDKWDRISVLCRNVQNACAVKN